jgi:hypothetical protein
VWKVCCWGYEPVFGWNLNRNRSNGLVRIVRVVT